MHKRKEIITKIENYPLESSHSFSLLWLPSYSCCSVWLPSYRYNRYYRDGKRELTFSFFQLNFIEYAIALGVNNFIGQPRRGIYWGYNLLLLSTVSEKGKSVAKLQSVEYLGKRGLLPSLELGYRFRFIEFNRILTLTRENEKPQMKPFFITAKLHLFPIKDKIFTLPLNDIHNGLQLYPSIGFDFPLSWWKEHLKPVLISPQEEVIAQIDSSKIIRKTFSFSYGLTRNRNIIEIAKDYRVTNYFSTYVFSGWPSVYGIGLEVNTNYNYHGFFAGFSLGRDQVHKKTNSALFIGYNLVHPYYSSIFASLGLSINKLQLSDVPDEKGQLIFSIIDKDFYVYPLFQLQYKF